MVGDLASLIGISSMIVFLIIIAVIWELVWKGIGLWKAGRNNQKTWFVFILIFNTLGILPIVYILFFQRKNK
jgi:hypothetical protein